MLWRTDSLLPLAMILLGVALLAQGGRVRAAALEGRAFPETRVEGAAFPRRLVSGAGDEAVLERPPRRIASAVLPADVVLAELAPERVVAVTRFVDDPGVSGALGRYPAEVERIVSADAEQLLALEPDLIFLAGYSRVETIRLLSSAGIPLVRLTDGASFEEIRRNIRLVGAAVGEDEGAERLVREMDGRLERVRLRVEGLPRPRVLVYAPGGFTSGLGTTIHEMIEMGGGVNVAAEAGLRGPSQLSEEMAIGLEPEVILVADHTGDPEGAIAFLRDDRRWADVPALRDGRLHAVPGAPLLAVSHDAGEGAEAVARLLHPEAFP